MLKTKTAPIKATSTSIIFENVKTNRTTKKQRVLNKRKTCSAEAARRDWPNGHPDDNNEGSTSFNPER